MQSQLILARQSQLSFRLDGATTPAPPARQRSAAPPCRPRLLALAQLRTTPGRLPLARAAVLMPLRSFSRALVVKRWFGWYQT